MCTSSPANFSLEEDEIMNDDFEFGQDEFIPLQSQIYKFSDDTFHVDSSEDEALPIGTQQFVTHSNQNLQQKIVLDDDMFSPIDEGDLEKVVEFMDSCESSRSQSQQNKSQMEEDDELFRLTSSKDMEVEVIPTQLFEEMTKLDPTSSKNDATAKIPNSPVTPCSTISSSSVCESPIKTPASPLTEEKFSLEYWGIPEDVVKYYKENLRKTRLYAWQVACLDQKEVSVFGENLVYCAPTSGGKTLVAEILMIRRMMKLRKKALFIVPFVSVVEEKVAYLHNIFEPMGLHVNSHFAKKLGMFFEEEDIAVCTIEKANSIVNHMLEKGKLDDLCMIIVDEIHMISDSDRGYLLELLLTKLKYINPGNIQIIGMSATLPNIDILGEWLNAHVFITNFRPVPLEEFIKVGNTIYNSKGKAVRSISSRLKSEDPTMLIPLCEEITQHDLGVIVFCATKNDCEKVAKHIAKYIRAPEREKGKRKLLVNSLRRTPSSIDPTLEITIPKGVAFHHAGLTFDERDLIEEGFRNGHILVLTCTTTLSAGVNLPARRVIFHKPKIGLDVLDVIRYKQAAGRAGRAGQDTHGESILMASPAEQKFAKQLLVAPLPELKSCLTEQQRGMTRALLEVIAGGVVETVYDIDRFIKCTLLSAQSPYEEVRKVTKNALLFLERKEFIEWNTTEKKFQITKLGQAAFSSSMTVEEGLIVLDELSTARKRMVLDIDLHLVYLVTPIFHNIQPDWKLYLRMYEKFTHDKKRVADAVGISESFLCHSIHNAPSWNSKNLEVLRHKRFYAALILNDLIQEIPLPKVEAEYRVSRGTIQSLQQAAASYSGMVTVFCQRLKWWPLEVLLRHMKERLDYGVQQDILPLLAIPFLKPYRARALFNAGYKTLEQLATADRKEIEKILCNALPFRTKKTESDAELNMNDFRLIESRVAGLIVEEVRKILKNGSEPPNTPSSQTTRDKTPLHNQKKEKSIKDGRNSVRKQLKFESPKKSIVKKPLEKKTQENQLEKSNPVSKSIPVPPKKIENPSHKSNIHSIPDKSPKNLNGTASNNQVIKKEENQSMLNSLVKMVQQDKNTPQQPQVLRPISSSVANIPRKFKPPQRKITKMKPPPMKRTVDSNIKQSKRKKRKMDDIPQNLDSHYALPFALTRIRSDTDFETFLKIWSQQKRYSIRFHAQEIVHPGVKKYAKRYKIHGVAVCWAEIPQKTSVELESIPIKECFYIELNDNVRKKRLNAIKKLLEDGNTKKICFGMKEQLRILLQYSIVIEGPLMDPLVAAWVSNPEERKNELSLDELMNEHMKSMVIPGLPRDHVEKTAKMAVQAWLLMSKLEELLQSSGQISTFTDIEMRLVPILANMEYVGIRYDESVCQQFKRTIYDKLQLLEQKAHSQAQREFKLTSPQEVAMILFDHLQLPEIHVGLKSKPRTKSGKRRHPSTAIEVLQKLRPYHEIVDTLIEHRKLSTLMNKYIYPLPSFASYDPETKYMKMYATHLQTTTATGRIATTEPNLQTLPHEIEFPSPDITDPDKMTMIKVNIRKTLIPSDGYLMLSADYSQIEVRILAHVTQDQNLMKVFQKETDIFQEIAARILDKPVDQVTKQDRNKAKRVTYGIIYGMGPKTLADKLEVDITEASMYISDFLKKYPKVAQWMESAPEECRKNGFVESVCKRRRYITNIFSTDHKDRSAAERQALNTICQGSAADLIKVAMINIYTKLNYDAEYLITENSRTVPAAKMLLQIHDELLFEVKIEYLEKVMKMVKREMEAAAKAIELSVPTPVKLHVGKNWCDLTDCTV